MFRPIINKELDKPFHEVETLPLFIDLVEKESTIKGILFRPDTFEPINHPELRISNKVFENVSFSKTTIKNVRFSDCTFLKCLFIGTKIIDCNFQQCQFIDSNTNYISIESTYIDPRFFFGCVKGANYSNHAVHLYQVLLNNSMKEGQAAYSRAAEYQFNKWQSKLTYFKFAYGNPYKVNFAYLLKKNIPNITYRILFAYGLKMRAFLRTFLFFLIVFYLWNYKLWSQYMLTKKDVNVDSFDSKAANFNSVFFYTIDSYTKLIDSQIQPKADIGIYSSIVQSIVGLILLGGLIAIINNKYVR